LKLERVLPLVVEDIGKGVEGEPPRDGVDGALVDLDPTEWRGERLATKANGSRMGACDVPSSTKVSTSSRSPAWSRP
jgi:hypothetical protein